MNYLTRLFLFAVLSIWGFRLQGQQINKINLSQSLTENKLLLQNRKAEISKDKNRQAIRLDESKGEGIAWVKGLGFSEGTIEIDLKGKDVLQKSFLGIAFHAENDSTFEVIYFRPFNFQSKDSVRKIHAVQYVSHPIYTWKKLRDERNGQYEKAVAPAPDPNDWFHARIEVKGQEIKVYVNNAATPSLTVPKLNERQYGDIGLWVGEGSGGEFANLIIK